MMISSDHGLRMSASMRACCREILLTRQKIFEESAKKTGTNLNLLHLCAVFNMLYDRNKTVKPIAYDLAFYMSNVMAYNSYDKIYRVSQKKRSPTSNFDYSKMT